MSLFIRNCETYQHIFLDVVRERVAKRAELAYYEQKGVDIQQLAVLPDGVDVAEGDCVGITLLREKSQLATCQTMTDIEPFSISDYRAAVATIMNEYVEHKIVQDLFCQKVGRDMMPQCIAPVLVKCLLKDSSVNKLYRMLY